DVDDVLIALGRILGVLDRPVGPVLEPLRMLGQPRVVGRALDREVERDLEPGLGGLLDEAVEVGERAEGGMDGSVAALLAADRPRAAGVALLRRERVVRALAARDPDRVSRRVGRGVNAALGGEWEDG